MATKKREVDSMKSVRTKELDRLVATINQAYKEAEELRKSFVLTEIRFKSAGVPEKSKQMDNTLYAETLIQDIKKHLSYINEDLHQIEDC